MSDLPVPTAMEPLYAQIAQLLLRVLPPSWQSTLVEFVWVAPHVSESSATYEDAKGGESAYSTWDIGDDLDDLFLSLGALMEEAGHPRWEKALYSLERNGTFTVDFTYPDQEIARPSRPWDSESDSPA